ncbi:hypothetical protein BCR37DRAFT_375865 [Protomyces lactucae-debilis]|uniref:Uncharacterized protein n=1 Tax=Protomyces lactucae-debilis TaxID=2754530 RepID=A0A1Y2FZ24_PROLT|nr:uncharacterized protein BCR37DRAFT_375865 [Protomyces lactucae-debilis]ORY87905.1 hypothetical protein BCR37DRAFT_375865 [Protomyces lactucae-debilis]
MPPCLPPAHRPRHDVASFPLLSSLFHCFLLCSLLFTLLSHYCLLLLPTAEYCHSMFRPAEDMAEVQRLRAQLYHAESEKQKLAESLLLIAGNVPGERPSYLTAAAAPYHNPPSRQLYSTPPFVLPPKEKKPVPIVAPSAAPASTDHRPAHQGTSGNNGTDFPTDVLLLGSNAGRGPFLFRLEFSDGERQIDFPVHENDDPVEVVQRLRSQVTEPSTEEQVLSWVEAIRTKKTLWKKRRQQQQPRVNHRAAITPGPAAAATPSATIPESTRTSTEEARFSVIAETAPSVTSQSTTKAKESHQPATHKAVRVATPKLEPPTLGQKFDVPELTTSQQPAPAAADDWYSAPAATTIPQAQAPTVTKTVAKQAPAADSWDTAPATTTEWNAAPAPATNDWNAAPAPAINDWNATPAQADFTEETAPTQDAWQVEQQDDVYQVEESFGLHRKWPWVANGNGNGNGNATNGQQQKQQRAPAPTAPTAAAPSRAQQDWDDWQAPSSSPVGGVTPQKAPASDDWQAIPSQSSIHSSPQQLQRPAPTSLPPQASGNKMPAVPAMAAAPPQFANIQGNPNAGINERPPAPELVAPKYSPEEEAQMNAWANGSAAVAEPGTAAAAMDDWE